MDDLAASFNKAYTANVRPSFFGGVVSTRLQSQNLNKVLPQNVDRLQLLKQRKDSRGPAGAGSSSTPRPPAKKPKLTPAEQKAQQRRQLEEKRRRMQARVMADMQSDVGDKFDPQVHGAEAVKKPKHDPAATAALAVKRLKGDTHSSAMAATAAQTTKAVSSGATIKRTMPQGLPAKPVEKRLSTGQKVMIHNSMPRPRKLVAHKPSPLKAAAPSKGTASKASKPAFPSKACRSCRENKPLTEYFADKRLPDGATHMCSVCAKKKGLSGRLLTRDEVLSLFPNAVKGSSGAAQSGSSATAIGARQIKTPQATAACATGGPPGKNLQPSLRMISGNGKFYGASPSQGLPSASQGGRYGGSRMGRSQLDEYEEDFVVDDGEEDDWRKALSQVTRGYYRERHDDDLGSDRMMEASAADIRREEARSKRIGRLEDAEAEREEAERLAAKAKRALKKTKSKKKKKRRKGVSALIADEASDSDSADEDEEEYD